MGDLIGVENFFKAAKDGIQQYYTYRAIYTARESWRAYNPDAPYDTIPVYGPGNGEILEYKIVKAEQYSVRHGEWRYFDPETGRLYKGKNTTTTSWKNPMPVRPPPIKASPYKNQTRLPKCWNGKKEQGKKKSIAWRKNRDVIPLYLLQIKYGTAMCHYATIPLWNI